MADDGRVEARLNRVDTRLLSVERSVTSVAASLEGFVQELRAFRVATMVEFEMIEERLKRMAANQDGHRPSLPDAPGPN